MEEEGKATGKEKTENADSEPEEPGKALIRREQSLRVEQGRG